MLLALFHVTTLSFFYFYKFIFHIPVPLHFCILMYTLLFALFAEIEGKPSLFISEMNNMLFLNLKNLCISKVKVLVSKIEF